jgi:hypothetical protein
MYWLSWLAVIVTGAPTAQASTPIRQKLDAGPIAVEVDCGRQVVPLYDVVRVSVTMTAPATVDVEWPAWGQTSDNYRLLNTATEGPDHVGRFMARRWQVRLEPLAIGKLALPALTIRYRDGTADWQTREIALAVIEIVAGPTSSADPATLRPIVALPALEQTDWLPRALRWGAVGITLVVLAAWAMRDSRRKRPLSTPLAFALARLEALGGSALGEREARQTAGAVCQILREYLACRYGVAAVRRTTPELAAELAECPQFVKEQRPPLERLLAVADPQKFAGTSPRSADVADLIDECRRFLAGEPT